MEIDPYPTHEIKDLGDDDDVFLILLDPSKTLLDFGEIDFTPIDKIGFEGIKYYKQFGTLGEYTHLKVSKKKLMI
tara:strand:- start:3843 stop:4067 length:225 start_codon:yes stop_codon:yes gene_type:complete